MTITNEDKVLKSFDLTPLVQRDGYGIIKKVALTAVPIPIIIYILGWHELAISLFRGEVIGVIDTFIMLTGIKKALPYAKTPKIGLNIMKKYRWYRIISASTLIILMLKLNFFALGLCLGFLLIHIVLIINLIIIAYRLDKEGDVKKGV